MLRNFLKHIPKGAFAIMLLMTFSRSANAQTAKPHFIIHAQNADDIPNYEHAVKDFDFDVNLQHKVD